MSKYEISIRSTPDHYDILISYGEKVAEEREEKRERERRKEREKEREREEKRDLILELAFKHAHFTHISNSRPSPHLPCSCWSTRSTYAASQISPLPSLSQSRLKFPFLMIISRTNFGNSRLFCPILTKSRSVSRTRWSFSIWREKNLKWRDATARSSSWRRTCGIVQAEIFLFYFL